MRKEKKEQQSKNKWYVLDAEGKVLGRLAVRIAGILYGKHNSLFRKDLCVGDGVIVLNAEKMKVTGGKLEDKVYRRYSGYPGGLKTEKLESVLERKPEYVLMHAVRGMLPKNKVGRNALRMLKVYRGKEHPHSAQKPEVMSLA